MDRDDEIDKILKQKFENKILPSEEFENNMKKIINPGSQSDISPTEYIFKWLNDTEITLTHRNVTKISLDQIFITPDLEIKNETRKDDLKS